MRFALFLGALAWLLLQSPVQADEFDGWRSFASSSGDSKVRAAVEYLEFRAPVLLLNQQLFEKASLAGQEGAGKTTSRDAHRRQLTLLRWEHLFQEDRIRAAVATLDSLPQDQQSRMKSLRDSPLESSSPDSRIKDFLVGLAERGALFLEVDLKWLQVVFGFKALACWSNQKVLSGAIEMYRLDHPKELQDGLTPELMKKLLDAELLAESLEDPGYGEGSDVHYMLVDNSRIFCTHHGFQDPPATISAENTPREQLLAAGVTEEAILDRCADLPLVPEVLRGGPDILR